MEVADPIVCAGSAEAVGRAQGGAWHESIRSSLGLISELEGFRLAKPGLLPYPVFAWLAKRKAMGFWQREIEPQQPDLAAWLRGIADGASVPLRDLQLLNLLEPMLSDLRTSDDRDAEVNAAPPGGCSAVAIRGAKSPDAAAIIARNFDYIPPVQPYYRLREVRPASGFRSLQFTVAPLIGAVDGINEAGLAITCNYAYVVDTPSAAATVTMTVCEALSACSSTEEAAEFFSKARIWGGGILMLADASGDIASVEVANTRRHVHRPTDGADWLAHANRFREGTMREIEVSGTSHYGPRSPELLRGIRIHQSSEDRGARLRQLLDDSVGLSPDDLRVVMSDHGLDDAPSGNTVCMHGGYWFTTASLQLLPAERRMRVAFDTACGAEYREFGL